MCNRKISPNKEANKQAQVKSRTQSLLFGLRTVKVPLGGQKKRKGEAKKFKGHVF